MARQDGWYHGSTAKVAELADAPDLGSGGRQALGVRLPPFALLRSRVCARLPAEARTAKAGATECKHATEGCCRRLVHRSAEARKVDAAQPRRRTTPKPMKTEFVDVNATRKNVRVEIPTDVVNAEIDRIARDYSRKARVPGFRPGKTPPRVIKQRFKDQILHDVAHDLIPRAVGDALREKGLEAVDTPDVR